MTVQFNDQEIAQFLAVKSAFDQHGTLNPGKGIPVLKNCQEYRSLNPNEAAKSHAEQQKDEKLC